MKKILLGFFSFGLISLLFCLKPTSANATSNFIIESARICYSGTRNPYTYPSLRCYTANWRFSASVKNIGDSSNANESGVVNPDYDYGSHSMGNWRGEVTYMHNNIILAPGESIDFYHTISGWACEWFDFYTRGSLESPNDWRRIDIDSVGQCLAGPTPTPTPTPTSTPTSTPTPIPRTSFFDILSARICYNSRRYTRKVGGHDCYDGNYRYSTRIKNTGTEAGIAELKFHDLHTGYLNVSDFFTITAGSFIDKYYTESFELCGGPKFTVGPADGTGRIDDTWSQAEASSVVACVATPTPTPTPQPTATPTPQPTPTPACTTYYWQVEADNGSLSRLSLIRNFQVCISADSWFQTKEGDVHAGGEITSQIPTTATNRNFSTNDTGNYPGVVSYGTTANFGDGYPSAGTANHWLVQTTNPRKSFAYFYSLLDSPPLNPPPDPDDDPGGLASEIDDTHFSDGGIYAYNGDIATVDDGWDIGNKKIVVLTNRGFLIKGRIKIDTANGGSLVVIAQDNIGIDKNLVATGGVQNKFQGIFITDGIFNSSVEPDTYNFSSAASNKILVIDGLVVANSFTLGRDFSALGGGDYNNSTTPAETFRYDPTLVMNTHQGLWNYLHSWKELTP